MMCEFFVIAPVENDAALDNVFEEYLGNA